MCQCDRVGCDRIGAASADLAVCAVVSVAMQINQGRARTVAADIQPENVALVAQKSPAVAGKPILYEGLGVVHDASPSRLPSGLMGGSCADDHYSTLASRLAVRLASLPQATRYPGAQAAHPQQAQAGKACGAPA